MLLYVLLLSVNTVEPRFTNLIRSWRPFVTRNVRKPKLCVLNESYTATDALPPILPACRQPSLPACVFVTWDTVRHPRLFFFWKFFSWTDLFVMRSVREPRFHCVWYVFFMGCQNLGTAATLDSGVTVPRRGVPHHLCLCSDCNVLLPFASSVAWSAKNFFIHISEI
jgi:hypothetical protein